MILLAVVVWLAIGRAVNGSFKDYLTVIDDNESDVRSNLERLNAVNDKITPVLVTLSYILTLFVWPAELYLRFKFRGCEYGPDGHCTKHGGDPQE